MVEEGDAQLQPAGERGEDVRTGIREEAGERKGTRSCSLSGGERRGEDVGRGRTGIREEAGERKGTRSCSLRGREERGKMWEEDQGGGVGKKMRGKILKPAVPARREVKVKIFGWAKTSGWLKKHYLLHLPTHRASHLLAVLTISSCENYRPSHCHKSNRLKVDIKTTLTTVVGAFSIVERHAANAIFKADTLPFRKAGQN